MDADLPVEVRLVLVYIDIVERVHTEPGVESEAILVRPLSNGRQGNGLGREEVISMKPISIIQLGTKQNDNDMTDFNLWICGSVDFL